MIQHQKKDFEVTSTNNLLDNLEIQLFGLWAQKEK